MSHHATDWAIEQRGLKPAAKIVLWRLCDRYNPDYGCFPNQDLLAADCELSRSSLNVQLRALTEAGLIRREQRRDPQTRQQLSTRYRFAFEDDFGPVDGENPCPESGHGAVSRNGQKPCPDSGQSRVQNLDTNLVREPVSEPVIEKERASDRSIGGKPDDGRADDGRSSDGRGLDAFEAIWPTAATDDRVRTANAWAGLSANDRTAALDGVPGMLAEFERCKRSVCGGFTYLAQRRWTLVKPDAVGKAGGAGGTAEGKTYIAEFTRPWWVLIVQRTLAARTGEDIRRVKSSISLAVSAAAGISCDPADAPSAEDCAAFVKVFSGSDDYQAWGAWFRARGVHLPRRDKIWCWFPTRRPPAPDTGDTGSGDPGSGDPGGGDTGGGDGGSDDSAGLAAASGF